MKCNIKVCLRILVFIYFILPLYCLAWDGTLSPTSVVLSDGLCKGELASRIYTGPNYIDPYLYPTDSNTCLSDGFNYSDSYVGVLLTACDDNNKVRVTDTACWPDSGTYPGVVTPGYCCSLYSNTPPCDTGAKTVLCEELIARSRSFYPDQVVSSLRWPFKAYYGEKTYRGVNLPGYRAVFRLYGEEYCDDTYEFKRFNDVVSVGNYNNETYQFYSKRRGVESSIPFVDLALLQPVQTWNEYIPQGMLASPFKRRDIIDNHGGGGLYRLGVSPVGTQCGYDDYKIIVEPKPWYECNAGPGSYCYCTNPDGSCCGSYSWQGDTYFGWDTNYIVNGPYGTPRYYWLDPYQYVSWEFWRYPVDKKFQAIGPLELVASIATGFPDWGYITVPGGDDIDTDILVEKGYKYRFRFDMEGLIWSRDLGGWPCGSDLVDGLGSKNIGLGSVNNGLGIKSSGVGGFENRIR